MSARKRRQQPESGEETKPNRNAPELITCSAIVEGVSPPFPRVSCFDAYFSSTTTKPNMFLSATILIGIRNRSRHLEVLTKRRLPSQTKTPEDNGRTSICICEAMCQGEHYSCHDGVFRLNMTGNFMVVRLTLAKQFMSLKL